MLNWIETHTDILQIAVGVVTALVWVIYLHVLFAGMRRQRRSEILITLGGKRDLRGRVMVSNLGLEPIYVLDILLRVAGEGWVKTVSIAERRHDRPGQDDPSDKPTLQTPLKTGDSSDIGEFLTLLHRADPDADDAADTTGLRQIEVTVVAVTAATSSVVAAKRSFNVEDENGATTLHPNSLYARQIRGRLARRRIEKDIERNM